MSPARNRLLGLGCVASAIAADHSSPIHLQEKVAEYKASIKAQLTRAGLIRGQPRAVYSSLTSPSSALAQSSTSSSSPRAEHPPGWSERYPSFPHGRSYEPSRYHHANTVMSAMTGLDAISAGSELSIPSPFVTPNNASNQASLPYSNDISSMSSTSSYPLFLHTPSYILAGEPQGPLEHAICALASLHSSKANAAQHGYNAATATAESSDRAIDRRFYNKAYVMLMTATAAGRPYTERDAVSPYT
ncbi:uncharacterized protein PHACADRAFT_201719 [Phanerochaete carnosa HHB-10118-sp]|uniref:Transcription factor domain-containing protein n=1 Tax=Phanerochaete carnosa (strain HHB-10118-sp) TaxID=650164 RepID=K5WGX4_PHACS|nr:uncharacterized protein PHACADRAFT_201719 [Phanerochaete carnosa HHB-10118-sp]EKM49457.1 hypothetical protein PHACADRAFT_201719 [Phanerochaete carnosa HHB-10118-sp]